MKSYNNATINDKNSTDVLHRITGGRTMKIFLSGPMSGIHLYNRPAFLALETTLELMGCVVLNPARLPDGLEYHEYIKICEAMLEVSDCIYMMDGWEKSRGCQHELGLAYEWGKERVFDEFGVMEIMKGEE